MDINSSHLENPRCKSAILLQVSSETSHEWAPARSRPRFQEAHQRQHLFGMQACRKAFVSCETADSWEDALFCDTPQHCMSSLWKGTCPASERGHALRTTRRPPISVEQLPRRGNFVKAACTTAATSLLADLLRFLLSASVTNQGAILEELVAFYVGKEHHLKCQGGHASD